jgi:hypothetical protein
VAQLIVVIQVFVAERDPEDPLTDQRRDLVLDQFLAPVVVKARREPINEPDCAISRSSRSPPASEEMLPPSKPATTSRPSTAAKPNKPGIQSVGIG